MDAWKRLNTIISMDLKASTGRQGAIAFLSALLYEPGFSCLFCYRISALLYSAGFRRLGKLVWRRNSIKYGCYIHIHAKIAGGLKLPHPIGVVIGEGVEVSEWVTLYQGVTLGQGSNQQSYPVIATKVTIFANAVVFGAIRVGVGAIIGAAAVVNKSISDGDVVVGNPARPIVRPRPMQTAEDIE